MTATMTATRVAESTQNTADLPQQVLGSNGFEPDRPRAPGPDSESSFRSLLNTGEYATFDAFVAVGIVVVVVGLIQKLTF